MDCERTANKTVGLSKQGIIANAMRGQQRLHNPSVILGKPRMPPPLTQGRLCGRSKVSPAGSVPFWLLRYQRNSLPKCRFATLPYGYKLFCFAAYSLVGLNGSPGRRPLRCTQNRGENVGLYGVSGLHRKTRAFANTLLFLCEN